LDNVIQGLQKEIERTIDDFQKKETPSLSVLGKIYSGTTLVGANSSLILEETLEGGVINEIKIIRVTPEGKKVGEYNMQISPFR
jgi:hypothetical protein